MLPRRTLLSSLFFASSLAGCVGILGEFTVGDVSPTDDASSPDGGSGGSSDDASGSVDAALSDVANDTGADVATDASAEAGCTPPSTSCGNTCVDTSVSKQHCGACNAACLDGTGTATCAVSKCACLNPVHRYCDGAGCFPTNTDSNHCGPSCRVCQANSECNGGACVCAPGFGECQAGTCTDLLSNNANCGRCGNACGAGATCVGGKCRFAQAGQVCPVAGLAVGSSTDSIYWTEPCASAAAIRRCSLGAGCATTVPVPLYSAASGSLPVGIAAVKANDGNEYYWNTDNQGPTNNRLWRTLNNGSGRVDWTGFSAPGPAALATDGARLFWGTSSGVYRSSVNASGATLVLNANPSLLPGSSSPQGVATDGTRVYAGRQGMVGRTDGVVACPVASDCSASGEIQVFTGSGVSAVVSDGTNVYFSTVTAGVDAVYRCPIAGCSNGATPFWQANVGGVGVRHVPLAVDGANVYFNTRGAGALLSCPKTQATCPTPKQLQVGVAAGSILTAGGYVYWTENNGVRGVYRTQP